MTNKKTRKNRKQIKSLLVPVLEEHIWPLLQEEGFSWRRSLRFWRKDPDGRQSLEFVLRMSRRRTHPVQAYICPWITFRKPGIGEQMRKLLGEEKKLNGDPDILLHQSVGQVGPDSTETRWLLFDEEDLSDLGHSLREYVKAYVLPFLNHYRTSRDIVDGWEAGDKRLTPPPNGWIQMAAVCLDAGKKEQAAKILWSKVWGNSALRDEYRRALDLLGIDPALEQHELVLPGDGDP